MALLRQHFERMLVEHDKKGSDESIKIVEEVSESFTAFDDSSVSCCIDEAKNVEAAGTCATIDEATCDESTDDNEEDDTYYSDDDEDDISDSEDDESDDEDDCDDIANEGTQQSLSVCLENFVSENDAMKTLQTNASKANADCGLFLTVEMVESLRRKSSHNLSLENMQPSPKIDTHFVRSASVGDIDTGRKRANGMVLCHQTKSAMQSSYGPDDTSIAPIDILKTVLCEIGYTKFPHRRENLNDFYIEGRQSGYTSELLGAIRRGDLETIKLMNESGAVEQCCNQFRESIMHTAARRGQTDIIIYLVEVANLSLLVSCDTGRNPLHDACWTSNPNFDCIEYILEQCADLLLLCDNRGFTPLEYIPKDCHRRWGNFLESHRATLLKQLLTSKTQNGTPYFV